ncbi:MAG: DUF3014 domain-containing protein [Acidobacteria bacterium]|nr:DUF3014 domain-containing protein [Acidobacteriota bacterium]MBE3131124.1 DUF3014 domain-containing protein [Acidobacteriota bacterium]
MEDLHLDDEKGNEPKKVRGLAIAILVVLAAVVAVYYFATRKKPEAPVAPQTPPAESETLAGGEKASAGGLGEPLAFPAVALGESDPSVRDFAAALSTSPEFAKWLLTKDLVRKFVVAVDNVANGLSPKPHIDFFSPSGQFRIVRTKEGTLIDEAAYSRYDPVVGVVLSVDAVAAVRLYRAVKPLLREAYSDLGYPGVDFEDTLVRAMAELLETPAVEGLVVLEKKILSYAMTDETLEALSPAQKQLFRMGPKGVRAVHGKIRELAAALGIPESRLPATKSK